MAGPDQGTVFFWDLVQLADEGVDVGGHGDQDGRREVADGREGVGCSGGYDDELSGVQSPYLWAQGDREFAAEYDEPLVAPVMNMQRSLRFWMRGQIPPPHDKVSHHPRLLARRVYRVIFLPQVR